MHTDLVSRDSRKNRHNVVLDDRVRVADTAGEDLAEDLARSGLLHLDIDKLERFSGFLLEGGLVSLG
jgi:hypothetical protein